MFPLADARGRVRRLPGAASSTRTTRCAAKYVNSPEGELFRKGDLLYGLDLARAAIAKQDRAVVVEGNTDVIALRQAGFEPVVASMGTALTEQQLRELGRLTKRLSLCFDADAAGQDGDVARDGARRGAGLRHPGRLAPDRAPIRPTTRRASRRGSPAPRTTSPYRVRLEIERRCPTDSERSSASGSVLAPFAESPERQDALRLAARPARAAARAPGGAGAGGACARPARVSTQGCSKRASGWSATRSPACIAHPELDAAARRAHAGALRRRAAPACPRAPARAGRPPTRSWSRLLAELDALRRRTKRSTRRPPRSCCCGCGSAGSARAGAVDDLERRELAADHRDQEAVDSLSRSSGYLRVREPLAGAERRPRGRDRGT